MKLLILLMPLTLAKTSPEEREARKIERQKELADKRATKQAERAAERAARLRVKQAEREARKKALRTTTSPPSSTANELTDLLGLGGWQKGLRTEKRKRKTTIAFTTSTTLSTTTTSRTTSTTTQATTRPQVAISLRRGNFEVSAGTTQCYHAECSTLDECMATPVLTCQFDEVCSLTLRRQRGQVPTRYYFICEKRDSCVANKRSNGHLSRGQCHPSHSDSWFVPSTCRQCCAGDTCLNVFAQYDVDGQVSQKKWNWNRSLFP